MTKVQQLLAKKRKLERERAEKRGRLGELALQAERTEAEETESGEIQTRMVAIDRDWLETDTAIGDAGGGEATGIIELRGEQAEHARLVHGASIGRIVAAALEHRTTIGEDAELQQSLGLGANFIPLALLRTAKAASAPGALETRAVTPAPTNEGATADTPEVPIFSSGLAAYFGIPQPVVPVGNAVYNSVPWKGTVPQRVRIPPGNCRSSR